MDINKDIEFIREKKLIQISFSLYQIKLLFEGQIIIEIGNCIEYIDNNESIQNWNYLLSKNSFSINALLDISVTKASIDNSSNLKLKFRNGEFLIIKAAGDGNESYVIYNNKDFQVIY